MVYGLLDVPILNGIYENHVLTGGDHLVGDVQLLPSLHQPIIPWLFCRCAQAFLAAKSPQASSRAGTTGLRSSIHGDAHVTSMALRIQWAT